MPDVRTTRIPTEELKLPQPNQSTAVTVVVRTTRIPTEELKPDLARKLVRIWISPNDQNSDRGIETIRILTLYIQYPPGPNDQNSDRGIETVANPNLMFVIFIVRTTRIPTEELKL